MNLGTYIEEKRNKKSNVDLEKIRDGNTKRSRAQQWTHVCSKPDGNFLAQEHFTC